MRTATKKDISNTSADSRQPVKWGLTEIAIPIVVIHLLAMFAFLPDFVTWTNLIILMVCGAVFSQGITFGYHRLLSHGSLRVPKWLEYFYVGLALCCLQESPGKWVSVHRRHHSHSDDQDDPHSPQTSFFWSHVGWLLFTRNDVAEFAADEKYASDIMADPFYSALEKNPVLPGALYLIHGFVFWSIATLVYWLSGSEFSMAAWLGLGATLWGVLLRTVLVWHISWSVNSLTHRFGYQNYKTDDHSRNNWLVAMFSNGEGWHNNHHHDPASASVQHKWWELDITWLQIRVLEKLGLATHVIRPRHVRQAENQQQAVDQ